MKTSWEMESGRLTHRWTEIDENVEFTLLLAREDSEMLSSHLPTLPNFASHSPFGNPLFWVAPHLRPFA